MWLAIDLWKILASIFHYPSSCYEILYASLHSWYFLCLLSLQFYPQLALIRLNEASNCVWKESEYVVNPSDNRQKIQQYENELAIVEVFEEETVKRNIWGNKRWQNEPLEGQLRMIELSKGSIMYIDCYAKCFHGSEVAGIAVIVALLHIKDKALGQR